MPSKKKDDDVVMGDAEKDSKDAGKDDKKKKEEDEEIKEPELTPEEKALKEIGENADIILKAVEKRDKKIMSRVLRHLNGMRHQLNTPEILSAVIQKYYPDAFQFVADLDGFDTKMEVEETKPKADTKPQDKKDKKDKKDEKDAPSDKPAGPTPEEIKAEREAKAKALPELKVYIHLLTVLYLLDQKKPEGAIKAVDALAEYIKVQNRRSLDPLTAKVWYYYSLSYEQAGKLSSIRNQLLFAHRTACLQHNEPGQASLTNAILRNFLTAKLFSQADKFRLNTTFPESRSNYQHARYLFYTGKINSVQLHYSDALQNLSQALRKAPRKSALGFRQTVTKHLVIVQLLTGDIPDRALFKTEEDALRRSLDPYFQLTQAVRVGDLNAFNKAMTQFSDAFVSHGTFSLIVRLRHNVIKAGLRKINLSYSRISMKDICDKLNLESEEDAEYIVAKAIHDGVIDASIDRKSRSVISKETTDVYSTTEPQAAFHKRIVFCNTIHNGAVKALRFPPNAHKSQSELAEEELQKQKEKKKEAKRKAEAAGSDDKEKTKDKK